MTTQRKVVAVTGSSGYIGAKLLEHLEETPGLGKMVAFDTRPLPAPIHNIASFRRDISTPIDEELNLHRVSTLVHLAFSRRSSPNRRDGAIASERNREMLSSITRSCSRANIGHLIYLSSHTVYGARPDNPLPMNEDSPLRPAPGFQYANEHLRAERALTEFAHTMPEMKLTIFRCPAVLGTMAGIGLLREFYFPGPLGASDYNPPLQFVYDDDLARILCLAITRELPGVFNVPGEGVVFLRELDEALAMRQFLLPSGLARPVNRLTGGGFTTADHNLTRWPILLSAARLHSATGYRFRHTAQETVTAFAKSSEEVDRRLRKKVEILGSASPPP